MEEKKSFIINTIYFALIIALVYVCYKYLLPILLPFILGFLIAFVSLRICRKVFKNESKIVRIISNILIYLIIIAIIVLLIILGFNKIMDLVAQIPNEYKNSIEPVLNNLENYLITLDTNLPINIQTDVNQIISDVLDSIANFVTSLSSTIVSVGTSLISNTTSIIVSIILTIVSSFFFVIDYESIFAYLVSLMSENTKKTYYEVKAYVQNTVLLVLGSYALIMLITFIELFIGFLIFRIENASVLALVIAFLDILPVLGVGTVLIPWGLFLLITGDIGLGICILVLYLIITGIRNVIEPKIVGGNLGLHPLVTLSSMIVGLKTFGALGMFGFPLTISFFVKRANKDKE